MHAIVSYVQGQEYDSTHCWTVYPEILHFVLVLLLKETEKVVLLVLTVMQFYFYMT
jgi:hypothetical protein